jgi:predicted Zn-dependent protease with MMP-like domain
MFPIMPSFTTKICARQRGRSRIFGDTGAMRGRACLAISSAAALSAIACAVGLTWNLGSVGAAPAAERQIPVRNTSGRADCSAQPGYPTQAPVSQLGGRGGFPIIGSIDANGCDSSTYELAGSFGPPASFFAGPGFRPNQHAYQYGSQETTEILRGHQLIRVIDPTQRWLKVYKGYDACAESGSSLGSTAEVCIAPTPERRPDDWVPWVPVGIILGAMVLFMIHFLRPAGPVRRRRHYRRVHHTLAHALPSDTPEQLAGIDVRQLQKRLRRLERATSPDLSESQRHWFAGLIASGRHGLAIESLARWLAESHMPVPDHVRDEVLWIASSLKIEREVRPVLDAQVFAREEYVDPHLAQSSGFDVPLEAFEQLVAEGVDSLPPAFGKAMTNVAIVVEEEHPDRDRLGQYQGHPLAAPRYRTWLLHPDKITLYRRTICDHCHSHDEVKAMVYRVVIHEIAHHFGIDDPRLRELGW